MDAQSPSKRFTRGSMSKSNAMQEIRSKLKNDPIRLKEMSTKSKQFNIRIVEGDNENDFVFNTEEPNRIILSILVSEESSPRNNWLTIFLTRKDFDLVESGIYIDYPWGKKAFDLLILHLHNKIKHDGKYYRLYGFPLALQVWFYECCSNFDEEIVVIVSDHIPRILNWKTKKDFPRLEYFAKGMFRDDNNQLVFQNLTPTSMELKILELPLEYVQLDQSPTEISAANDSDDDFQDPPRPKNNKGKEKVDICSSPPKKKSRQTVTLIQKKTPPTVISKHPYLRKFPRHANVPKRPKSPLPKGQAKQRANVDSYTGIKQNVEIKSSVASEIPSTSKSHDFSISRDEFDQFKISILIF
ncbi:hypothetical protein MTR67_030136 [Solanum verrucosum]|uniref:DUF1985 domain-containing protein n=1 Tax=Solanum verrucosum TaxID=315347 RepID=A0AAF0R757_SOLVR|nr:hypothetical protein MTR67_030136 [Solanum verrucosum]